MVNEGECVCVCMWRCGCCVRACVTVYRGFVMAGFAALYDTSGPSWTSKTTATPPILRTPPYVWVWRCFGRSRSHVRLRAFLGVQCGTADPGQSPQDQLTVVCGCLVLSCLLTLYTAWNFRYSSSPRPLFIGPLGPQRAGSPSSQSHTIHTFGFTCTRRCL